ncbi:hypothetical protein HKX48_003456 [Thoreauomyces humboldtii]|nr:hypothetical protein HKX48_003456 [Thoreauomyces humboldtii]
MLTLPLLLLALLATSSALAPLEPPSGVLFGAWLDTTNEGDTPVKFNQRLGFQASLFQFSIELPIQPQSLPPVNLVDATNSDATLYITVFPQFDASYTATEVFDQLTTPVIGELVSLLNGYVSGGRNCIVRIASEMNGSWDAYTQRPTRYIAMWKTIVDAIRAGIPTSSAGKVAFLWSPSSGNGYPSPGGQYSPFSPNVKPYTNLTALYPDDFKLMDTNHDGVLSTLDDPYSPYYPGDE